MLLVKDPKTIHQYLFLDSQAVLGLIHNLHTLALISALKSSLKTAKRLQLDQSKTAKDQTCSLGLSVLRLEDREKTGCGGPVSLIKAGLLYPSNDLQNTSKIIFLGQKLTKIFSKL